MKNYSILLLLFILFAESAFSQMFFNGKYQYGNEWIVPNQKYYSFKISKDGMYQLGAQELLSAGIPIKNIEAKHFQIFKNGQEVPILTSTEGLFMDHDYIVFYGTKNKGELDASLFRINTPVFNPQYSMFTDEANYYFTWNDQTNGLRYESKPNDNSNPLVLESSFIKKQELVYNDFPIKRAHGTGKSLKLPDFDEGQGFGTNYLKDRIFNLDFKNLNSLNSDPVQINVRIFGDGAGDGTLHKVNFQADNTQIGTTTFTGFKVKQVNLLVPSDQVKPNLVLRVFANGNPDDQISISSIQYQYHSIFDFGQSSIAELYIEPSIIRKSIKLENFNGSNELMLFDLDNNYYLKSVQQTDRSYPIDLPPSDNERHLLIINPSNFLTGINLSEVKFQNYTNDNFNYLILTSKIFATNPQNAIVDYYNYRSSKEGGSYKVKIVYKEDIEEAFGFGIKSHSMAYKNFFQYARTIWPDMKYVLLVGKGLEYQETRQDTTNNEWNIIPTFSEPASDYLLVCDSMRVPFFTIGRLPILSNQELTAYLNKVKEHEALLNSTSYSIENREWLKRIIHLAGGDPTLYATLRSQLASMETEIENNKFGGLVETFNKESTSNVEVINSERLTNMITTGVSIISFMGHSISFKLDFNLDNIDDYKNKGRYHMFVAMGCYAGEMFLKNRSISEVQNLAADKGSIIYLANTTSGLPGILFRFGQDLYAQLGGDYYGKSVGDAMRQVFNNLIKTNTQENNYQALSTSFNGDPAIRLNNNLETDITPDGSTAITKDNFIFSDQKSFDFSVDLVNLGLATKDSVKVKIENIFPDGTKNPVYVGNVLIPGLRKKFTFSIPLADTKSIGSNTLLLTIDPENIIKEGPSPYAENNNTLITINNQVGFNYFVLGNNAKPLYPSEFAIINESKPNIVAYNSNTFAKKSNYYFELDTTELFNSTLRKTKNVFQTGGIITWSLGESLLPNQVYYWRVRPDSAGTSVLAWQNSSFIYIPGNEVGWNQSHVFQFQKNELQGIQITDTKRSFEYKDAIIEFAVLNGYIELPTFIRPKLFLGSEVSGDYRYWDFKSDLSGIVVAILDPLTGKLVPNKTGSDGGSQGGSAMANSNYYLFATDTKENRAILLNFLKNNIPDQAVVIVESLIQLNYSLNSSQWQSDGPENLVDFFKSVGAKNVDQFISEGDVPYALIYGKNRANYETRDKIGNRTDELNLKHSMTVKFKESVVQSKIIGPAASFDRFLWEYNGFDQSTDNQSIDIVGINNAGVETKLFGPLTNSSVDLKPIDAKVYPKIKLVWKSSDTTNRTPPNMSLWRIFYKGLPDIAFNPAFSYSKNYDTLNQGTSLKLELTSQNVSTYDMDSLLVNFKLVDQRNIIVSNQIRYIPVRAFQNFKFPYEIITTRLAGPYKLIIELNPNQDQAEFVTYNNIAIIDFYVRKDRRKAKLSIYFNGLVINNGDIVSPKSQIIVNMRDENNSIPLDNPNLFTLKIKSPDGNIIDIDPAKQTNVSFIPPATMSKVNEASIVIDGDFQQNGSYFLIVRAKDANGNLVSETEENVEFRIIKESSISNVFNYPNPFSTRTKFVYTLTGSKSPSSFKIQIMSISGKIVRELDQNEIGPLNIGTHMTEFEYDGTDEFGQKLANGVYLYRAIFKDEIGNDIKKFENNTDKFFVNNYGKMVILR